ncbi:MAG: hypothetical protein HW373_978, partial [Deltaproteobacteria bacterium]|nr:hypothetical protein [Deltaproteobacteria bacterium]
ILKRFVADDPFYSSTVFGVYAIVESAFLLSRNSYPIELSDLRTMFQRVSGKVNEWQAEKSFRLPVEPHGHARGAFQHTRGAES